MDEEIHAQRARDAHLKRYIETHDACGKKLRLTYEVDISNVSMKEKQAFIKNQHDLLAQFFKLG